MNLYISEAIEFVRTRLDELAASSSDMVVDTVDDRNLNNTVEKLLPEAVEEVHLAAPASLLEGFKFTEGASVFRVSLSNGVIDVDFRNPRQDADGFDVLRLAYFKCADGITTSAVYPEDSPEGRIQLNKYIQGQPDEPVVVRQADSTDYRPHLKYYTTKLNSADFEVSVFPVPVKKTDSAGDYFFISAQLKTPTLNRLTAKVLIAYGEVQKAQVYAGQASNQR